MVAPTIGEVIPGLLQQPGRRYLRARNAPSRSHLCDCFDNPPLCFRGLRVERLPELVLLGPGARRVPVAGEAPVRQRAPRHHRDARVPAQRQHLSLLLAIEEVHVVLHGDETVQPRFSERASALANCEACIDEAPM